MVDAGSIQEFIKTGLLGIVILVGAVVAATKYRQGGVRQAAEIAGVTLIACVIVAIATHTDEVGSWLWGLITGKKQ